MKNPVSVSFLITRPDYADFKTAAAKACVRHREAVLLRCAGSALVLAALVLRAFFSTGFYQNVIYTMVAVAGVIVGAFYDVTVHYFARRRAFVWYESNKERFTAQNAEFGEDAVRFSTDRYAAEIPYGMFYRVYEDGRVFLFYTGINELKFVPKRSMNEDECEQVRAVLKSRLQEKYQQEGAREWTK